MPINFKSTTTITSDNTGNMAMCVYALTDEKLCLTSDYNSGIMSQLLITKIKNNQLNKKYKKHYYFLVVNKNNTKQIICNSFKGLTKLTPNINNLPFQIKWIDNINFVYKKIDDIKNNFIQIIKKPKPSWKEQFLNEIRNI